MTKRKTDPKADPKVPKQSWKGIKDSTTRRKILECVSPDRTPEGLTELCEKLDACARTFSGRAEEFRVLASESRLKILALLECAGELCVCDLATVLDISPAAVSQHLSRLRSAAMVKARRDGMTTYYALARNPWPAPLTEPLLEDDHD